MKIRTVLATVAVLATMNACKGDDDSGNAQMDATAGDAGIGDVKCPADVPEFAANPSSGIEAAVKHKTLQARVIKATPVHPTKNAMNNWTVQFTDDQDKPLDDVEIAAACAFMPVHGHGTAPLGGHKKLSDPGQYELDYLNFTMRGPWKVELALSRSASSGDGGASTPSAGGSQPMEFTDCDRNRKYPGTEFAMFYFCVKDD
jgi:hypothetical protein